MDETPYQPDTDANVPPHVPYPPSEPDYPPRPPRPRRRPRVNWVSTGLSWLVILGLVLGVFLMNLLGGPGPSPQGQTQAQGPVEDPIGIEMMKLQSRVFLAQTELDRSQAATVYGQAGSLNTGTVAQRLRFVVMAAEMMGPEEGLHVLDDLDRRVGESPDVEYGEKDLRVRDALRALYLGYENDETSDVTLSSDERALLRNELDWFGELALTPQDAADEARRREVLAPSVRTMLVLLVVVAAGGALGIAGFVGLIILLAMALFGKLPNRIGPRLPHAHIYAETFAVWLIVFFVLQEVIGLLGVPQRDALAASAVAFFLSLIALGWAPFRGVPFKQVRRDIGWTAGPLPVLEPVIGVGCYAMALPLLGIGIALMFVLVLLSGAAAGMLGGGGEDLANNFGPSGGPAHPIIVFAGGSGVWPKLQLYLVAAIAAPIVEETMFRGVLYRHLRSLSVPLGVGGSIVVSALFNGLIFASIHPQGFIAIPALASLAVAMSLAREWRGTLIGAMVVHGCSNGVVMTMLLLLLG